MRQQEGRQTILGVIDTKTKVLALVTLVIEATFLGSVAFLPPDNVIYALIICAAVFVIVVAGSVLVELYDIRSKHRATSDLSPSSLTPDSPILNAIIKGAIHTVCRGVTIPQTPEEAALRAFIFKNQGNALVCTHYWAPESLRVKEEVGLTFVLDRRLADQVSVVRAYFDWCPSRLLKKSKIYRNLRAPQIGKWVFLAAKSPFFSSLLGHQSSQSKMRPKGCAVRSQRILVLSLPSLYTTATPRSPYGGWSTLIRPMT